ncbi:hypothetical protein HK105_201306 [Polyrhizophydium stewartii]|uniref:Cytochrome P450 n=1 Tax=Polyrhizophydium stewartii TaxID=2732419 RepID=A0ABR4NHU5_9FUNG|nr:hypothetical protein HK105_006091 [Polyrhizophydium stewartii]
MWLQSFAAASLALVAIAAVRWRLAARRKTALIKALNPSVATVTYSFPRYISVIDLGSVGLFPDSWMELPRDWLLRLKHKVFADRGKDAFFLVDSKMIELHVADADMMREISTRRTEYPKLIKFYAALDLLGSNVVTTEHMEWRRHRKISAPQFSEKNNVFVHHQTLLTVKDMFRFWHATARLPSSSARLTDDTVIATRDGIIVNVTHDMIKLALHVFTSAGFGIKLNWADSDDEQKLPANHKMSFKDAVHGTIFSTTPKLLLPKFAFELPIPYLKKVHQYYVEFEQYLREMVRDAENQTEPNLLVSLTNAVKADNPANSILSEQELVGNMSVFMFAGHETTANTMNFSLGLLAAHQDVQQRLYEEIQTVLGNGEMEYRHIQELVYTLAVMNETLRLFPSAIQLPRITNGEQNLCGVILPDATAISVDIVALHYNPKYWGPDPDVFRPERWFASPECARSAKTTADAVRANANARSTKEAPAMDGDLPQQAQPLLSYNRYAFMAFYEGARSCLGKRFAQVEFITTIATIVQNYSIHLPDDVSPEAALHPSCLMTLQTTKPLRVVFRRRPNAPVPV